MRIKPLSLCYTWLVAFSLVASSGEGQQVSDYKSWSPRPRLLRTSPPPKVKPMNQQTYRLESTPFGIDVRLFLDNKREVNGELLFVDEESITIETSYNRKQTFQLKELSMVKGRFGRIAPRTRWVQFAGVVTTLATGYLFLYAAPANLAIATAVNCSLKKSLRFKTRHPETDWRFLREYSRHPAGWPDGQLMP